MAEQARDLLIQELLALSEGHGPRFLMLVGERGIGKTFLAQQLYRQRAAQQPPPAFWPRDLLADPPLLEEDRNTIRPGSFAVQPDAVPTYAWLAIACGRARDGAAFNALGAAVTQIVRLQNVVERALNLGHAGRSRAVLLNLLEIIVTFAGLVSADAAAVGVALTARSASAIYREAAAARAESADVHAADAPGWVFDPSQPDPSTVAAYVGFLTALTERANLPTILVVDDVHDADASLLSLLAALPNEISRNLIVLCTCVEDTPTPALLTSFDRIELGPLEPTTLDGIVREQAPDTDPRTVAAFTRRSKGNPYRLKLMLDTPVAQARDGTIELTPAQVAALPDQFEDLYRRTWSQLSHPTQVILAVAATQGSSVSPDVLAEACVAVGQPRVDQALAELSHRHWLLTNADGTMAFASDERYTVALAQARAGAVLTLDELRRSGSRGLTVALARLASENIDALVSSGTNVPGGALGYLQTVVNLGAEHGLQAPAEVAESTEILSRYLLSRGFPAKSASDLERVGYALCEDPTTRLLGLRLRILASHHWGHAGRSADATDTLKSLRALYLSELNESRELSRLFSYVAGIELCRQGYVSTGIARLKRVCEDPQDDDHLGWASREAVTRFALTEGDPANGLAAVAENHRLLSGNPAAVSWWQDPTYAAGVRAAASAHGLRDVTAARIVHEGPDGRFVDHQLGRVHITATTLLYELGLEITGDMLAGLELVGPSHRATCIVLDYRATYLSYLGRGNEALALHARAIDINGGRADGGGRDALVSRANLAQTWSRLGQHDDALASLAAIEAEMAELFGQKHRHVLGVRLEAVRVHLRAGDDVKALEQLEGLVEDYRSTPGTDLIEVALADALEKGRSDSGYMRKVLATGSERPQIIMWNDRRRLSVYRRRRAQERELLASGRMSLQTRIRRKIFDGIADQTIAVAGRWLQDEGSACRESADAGSAARDARGESS